MRRYLAITKNSIMAGAIYRFHFLFTCLGNLLYIVLIFFLWKAIYKDSGKVMNGMTFNQVFVYLSLASAIFCLFQTWTEWDMSRSVVSGNIVSYLTRPLDYQIQIMFEIMGFIITNFITITLPAILIIIFVFKANIVIGINMLFFIAAVILSFLLVFNIDFMVGLISFYTESIWGLSITKEVIVLLLSGALIPLNFFPEHIRSIVKLLPFQAIYNIPLTTLTSNSLQIEDYFSLLGVQALWVFIFFVLSRMFYNRAIKVITVNGG